MVTVAKLCFKNWGGWLFAARIAHEADVSPEIEDGRFRQGPRQVSAKVGTTSGRQFAVTCVSRVGH